MKGAKQKEMFEISDLRRRETLYLRSVCPFVHPGGRGWGTLIFSYIGRLGLFFLGGGGGSKFCISILLGFSEENFMDFWGLHKIGLYLEQGTEWIVYFWGC